MTATQTFWTRRRAARAALIAASLIAALASCSVAGPSDAGSTAATAPASSSTTAAAAAGMPVVLQFDDQLASATLADTRAAREFAAMLPVTVELTDRMGQAKSGRLPHPIPAEGAVRILKPTPGGIYYWPDTTALAVYYDDLGQSVPPPGLIRLGGVDTGLDDLADASNWTRLRIDVAAETNSYPPT
jgi:hypothetical protein